MPAPHRRNKGESIAKKVATARHIDTLDDRREHQTAHRIASERARRLDEYAEDVRRGRVTLPRYTLDCVGCGERMRFHRRTPRVPLCQRCKDRRAAKRIEKRPNTKARTLR